MPEKYKTFSKEDIITLYENLEKVLRSKNYDENLRQELQKSNPDYLKVLGKRKADMEKPDHSIVIAGKLLKVYLQLLKKKKTNLYILKDCRIRKLLRRFFGNLFSQANHSLGYLVFRISSPQL